MIETFVPGGVLPGLAEAEDQVNRHGLWAAGFIAYEAASAFDPALPVKLPSAGLPLLWMGLYGAPEKDGASEAGPAPASAAEMTPVWDGIFDRAGYHDAFRYIKTMIRRGEIYQANLTYRLRGRFSGDSWRFFCEMAAAQESDYAAYLNLGRWTLCSASPELFFALDGSRLSSIPMKGTRERGLWPARDRVHARGLRRSVKERAENAMIADMVRNDIGKVAEPGSVRVERPFEVLRFPTVWQMVTRVEARTDASVVEIMRAMFPPASITGAPKRSAMRVIRHVETSPRGVYTGAIGFMAPGRQAQFNVAIRTAVCDNSAKRLDYGVGGGIVWDSREEREHRECLAKTRVLNHPQPDFDLLETMLWTRREGFARLAAHLRRLKASATYFGRSCDRAAIRQLLKEQSSAWRGDDRRVRLRLGRSGNLDIESFPLRLLPPEPLVCLADSPVNSGDRFLYHKTTLRDIYETALRSHPECDDVLLWNEKGEMTESCIANLVVTLHGEDFTPPVRCGLLPGVMRAEWLRKGRIRERVIAREEMFSADRIFLLSSLRGIREARLRYRNDA